MCPFQLLQYITCTFSSSSSASLSSIAIVPGRHKADPSTLSQATGKLRGLVHLSFQGTWQHTASCSSRAVSQTLSTGELLHPLIFQKSTAMPRFSWIITTHLHMDCFHIPQVWSQSKTETTPWTTIYVLKQPSAPNSGSSWSDAHKQGQPRFPTTTLSQPNTLLNMPLLWTANDFFPGFYFTPNLGDVQALSHVTSALATIKTRSLCFEEPPLLAAGHGHQGQTRRLKKELKYKPLLQGNAHREA